MAIKPCKYLLALLLFFGALQQTRATGNGFVIASDKVIAGICIDKNEIPVVQTAGDLFIKDVRQITGKELKKSTDITKTPDNSFILAGTIGTNPLFEDICKRAEIDIKLLKETDEAFIIKHCYIPVLKQKVLLIAGSTPRGTAYGILEISREVGVSPWHWWADVNPETRNEIILPEGFYSQQKPSIKYRGIFLNDEDWGLEPWAANTFEPEARTIGPRTYEKIFEVLLRLRANTIWPAMHKCTKAFFSVEGNKEMAHKYGILIGTSHCEPILRNNEGEWEDTKYGSYNFLTNKEIIVDYWEERAKEAAPYENIYTIGMRGVHDGKMQGAKTIDEQRQVLEKVFAEQRKIIDQNAGKIHQSVPQVFIPYKEVLDVYDKGLVVPEDVTLIWTDDNYGYIRRLSDEKEQKRSGGAGVYYHISYWGRPHDYLWLSTTSPGLIWHEMNKAYTYNAREMWIVNVGDLKMMEYNTELFLDMAWNINAIGKDDIDLHLKKWAEREFGNTLAIEIAGVMEEYYRLAFLRRPEMMGWSRVEPSTETKDSEFNPLLNGDETERRIQSYKIIADKAVEIGERIPVFRKDAYFQLVQYQVVCAYLMNCKFLYAQKARVVEHDNPAKAEEYKQKSIDAYNRIKEYSRYFNTGMAGGKWNRMMDDSPRNLAAFKAPDFTKETTTEYSPKAENTEIIAVRLDKYIHNKKGVRSEWQEVKGMGHNGRIMMVSPFKFEPDTCLQNNPSLTYEFQITGKGVFTLDIGLLPMHPVSKGGDMRIAVSIDGEKPQIKSFRTKGRSENWKANVERNMAIVKIKKELKPGKHTLTIYPIDPGVVLDQITGYFGNPLFYLGPEL